jgi:GT2 family glycosyltransferase
MCAPPVQLPERGRLLQRSGDCHAARVVGRDGGFDEHYLPAYCEDADLAFRVRARLRCLYQPRAEVIHHEGAAMAAMWIKAYQVANQAKLRERWAGLGAPLSQCAECVPRA